MLGYFYKLPNIAPNTKIIVHFVHKKDGNKPDMKIMEQIDHEKESLMKCIFTNANEIWHIYC